MSGKVGWNMENDQQIKMNLEQVKNVFLSDELLVKDVKPEVYSLSDEFAKSKKNKNILVYALITLYITVIGVGAFFLTTLEDNKSKRVEVNIAEFRQFNLFELLTEKKENEEKLTKLQQELVEMRANSLKEIQKLSPVNQQKAIAELNEKMKKLEADYQQKIASKEVSIRVLERSITGEQQQAIKITQDNQSQLKNYQTMNQMQGAELVRINTEYAAKISKLTADHQAEIDNLKKDNQKLINELTLRYNPVYSRGEIATIINSKLGNTSANSLNKYNTTLTNSGIFDQQNFDQLRKKIQGQQVILGQLQQIPYTNSMPLALDKLDKLSQSIIGDYETLWGGLANRVDTDNSYLNSYEYAVNYLSMTRRESGFIIDARDMNRIVIFVDRAYSIKNGDTAYVFKNDDTPVAKLELILDHGRVIAKVKEILKPVKIEPFDKILLKLGVTP
ncbi:MAG TPA: hypothetical protein DDW65_00545 [Firmicutes bacterium]|jgi:hypothetical protein|nr:hypothetical protein [Bacillota bacterium]